MSNLLFVASSASGGQSKSRLIAEEFVSAWRASHPGTKLIVRDLGADPVPHFAGEHLAALSATPEHRTNAQRELIAASDTLIEEVEAADTIVIAAPMYNFTIASTLKAWIDHVTRAGRTFRYAAQGPEGLLKDKKVFVVTGRGGFYSGESPMKAYDFQEPYLRTILGFLGLTDVSFIHVEGQMVSPDAAVQGVAQARQTIGTFFPAANAA